LLFAALPVWSRLRGNVSFQAALRGVNAAVVGLLLAALYDPVFVSSVLEAADFATVLAAFGALAFWRAPPWAVVLFCAVSAEVVAAI
jgi:chromate transporter